MDVLNELPVPVKTVREFPADSRGVVVALTKITYRIEGDRPVLARDQVPIYEAPCTEAPLTDCRYLQEPGVVDITVVGDILAPDRGRTRSVLVELSWGRERRSLRAFGKRRWRRAGGGWAATDPDRFERLPMSWTLAFGGRRKLPAGFAPHTRLPMPSTEVAFADNPDGVGFTIEENDAEGQLLPQLEDPEALVESPADRPKPACFAPCPMDSALRYAHLLDTATGRLAAAKRPNAPGVAACFQNAAPDLRTERLDPGVPFRLSGMTADRPLEFALPPVPVRWVLSCGGRTHETIPTCVAIQLLPAREAFTALLRAEVPYPLIRYEKRTLRMVPRGDIPVHVE